MEIFDYTKEEKAKLKRYAGRLGLMRLCIYVIVAILYIIYAAPLFSLSDGSDIQIESKIWLQFALVTILLLLNIFSYKKPFTAFLIICIIDAFVALVLTTSAFMIRLYSSGNDQVIGTRVYIALLVIYLVLAMLTWSIANARKYERLKKSIEMSSYE